MAHLCHFERSREIYDDCERPRVVLGAASALGDLEWQAGGRSQISRLRCAALEMTRK